MTTERDYAWLSTALVIATLILLAVVPLLSGCTPHLAPNSNDPVLARQTLVNVLESWKRGKAPDWWRDQHPEVVVQDMDWMAGRPLHDFQLVGDGQVVDANLHQTVHLMLAVDKGVTSNKQVTYLVTTSPKLTVFRALLQ